MAARISVLLSLTFWACEPTAEKILDHTFPHEKWIYPDTIWGELYIPSPSSCRHLSLHIDLEEKYPWRNLYLLIWTQQPDGFRSSSRVELVFTDSLGEWYVRNRRFRTFVARNLSFSAAGTYRIGLLPYVRKDTLPGVRRVGLYAHACQ
ncbi:MAG: gliding motility lipoprotein GldH [Bacteroidia bacterium]|nr:gliding motility lipoprotein GldH [Bacteroidia bacterium]